MCSYSVEIGGILIERHTISIIASVRARQEARVEALELRIAKLEHQVIQLKKKRAIRR